MSLEQRVVELERRLEAAQRDMNRLQLYLPPPPRTRLIKIFGGNLVSTVSGIEYNAEDPEATELYDPETAGDDLESGLGVGILMNLDGTEGRKVLVWNEWAAYGAFMVGGYVGVIRGSTTLAVASGDDMGALYLVYLLTYPA